MIRKISSFNDWNELYRKEKVENMPWFSPKLDHDLDEALKNVVGRFASLASNKKILSLGEGPGTQAIELAKKGYSVTATDVSEAAVRKAEARAKKEGAKINFVVDDIVKTKLKEKFSAVFDRGCFHVLEPEDRQKYVKNVYNLLSEGGLLFLKCFSFKEKRRTYDRRSSSTLGGPHRFKPEEIKEIFGKHFDVLSITETYFEGTLEEKPKVRRFAGKPKALFAIIRKK